MSSEKIQARSMDPDDLIKKWSPLTEGLSEISSGLCAWCMEHESKMLQQMSEGERAEQIGPAIKFLFPAIRRTVEQFSVLDRVASMDEAEFLGGVFQYQVNAACDAICATLRDDGRHALTDVDPEALKSNALFSSLGARLADYTLRYPRLT